MDPNDKPPRRGIWLKNAAGEWIEVDPDPDLDDLPDALVGPGEPDDDMEFDWLELWTRR